MTYIILCIGSYVLFSHTLYIYNCIHVLDEKIRKYDGAFHDNMHRYMGHVFRSSVTNPAHWSWWNCSAAASDAKVNAVSYIYICIRHYIYIYV